jgi:hypothetical protein
MHKLPTKEKNCKLVARNLKPSKMAQKPERPDAEF